MNYEWYSIVSGTYILFNITLGVHLIIYQALIVANWHSKEMHCSLLLAAGNKSSSFDTCPNHVIFCFWPTFWFVWIILNRHLKKCACMCTLCSVWIMHACMHAVLTLRSQEVATQIHDEGMGFLRSFRTLGRISVGLGQQMFLMKPKFHVAKLHLGITTTAPINKSKFAKVKNILCCFHPGWV